jgi:hypothetical protein
VGAIRAGDRALYGEMLESVRGGQTLQFFMQSERLWESLAVRLGLLVMVPFMIAFVAWLIAGWGAYRTQHHVSRIRSILAFLLFGILCLPVIVLMFVVMNALVR